ncbi:MAG: hypothetical protein QXL14_03085 [Candidatus Aenigmatarchaeota archaeon]
MNDVKFILTISLMYAFLIYLFNFTDIPDQFKFLTSWDYIWFAGGFVAIASACVVAPSLTGAVGCPVVLGAYSLMTVFNYIVVQNDIIKLLFFVPMIITFIYIISKLARGTM